MEKITRQSLASTAADRWKQVYYQHGDWRYGYCESIWEKLESLGPEPNPDDVDRIIGHGGWTSVYACDECNRIPATVVVIGKGEDSDMVGLCRPCLVKAVELTDS